MNKREAKYAMKQGKKLTHENFSEEEWVSETVGERYVFEDGVITNTEDFWKYRDTSDWNKGWSIFINN